MLIFAAFTALLERVRSTAVHPRPAQAPIVGIGDAKRTINSARKRAGLPHLSHHAIRHFFFSNANKHGVVFRTIIAWVGHRDGGVLVAKTYGHLRDTHSAGMARRMSFMAPVPLPPSKSRLGREPDMAPQQAAVEHGLYIKQRLGHRRRAPPQPWFWKMLNP